MLANATTTALQMGARHAQDSATLLILYYKLQHIHAGSFSICEYGKAVEQLNYGVTMQTDRRNFLKTAGSLWVGAVWAPGCNGTDKEEESGRTILLSPQWITTTLDGLTVRLRAYNGELPGPTLELVPGETVEIVVDNQLTPYDSSA